MPELPEHEDHPLFLDELTEQLGRTMQLLSGDPDEAALRAFAEIGIDTHAEAVLLNELAARGPLAHPDRFEDAHRLTMRALEVIDRDGWKHPRLRRLGPLSGIAQSGVEYVAKAIVRSHVSDVVRTLARLYARRESQAPTGSTERQMLARARIQADRLSIGFGGGGSGLRTVLVGGAALPVLASVARQAGTVSAAGPGPLIGLGVLLALVFAALSWVMLQGAALAHRRITVGLLPSLKALYQTIGHCGDPPEDDSPTLAAIAIGLTFVAWFVVPLAIGAVIALF